MALSWRHRARKQNEGAHHRRRGRPRACAPFHSLDALGGEIDPTSQRQFIQMDPRYISGALGLQWQEGYGAFSIGVSGIEDTTKYIQNQAEHHRKVTFKEEIETFLKKHGMEYVEQDLE